MSKSKGYINKSKSDNWGTPDDIMEKYKDWFDPCPYNYDVDGLTIEWKDKNFVNPPYSKCKEWVKKCYDEWNKGKTVHLLIFANTDTKYFHDYIYPYAKIEFLKGRLKFKSLDGKSKNGVAPKGSMICKFEHN